jgi:hypothetical protein
MSFITRPVFSDRQIVQSSGETITLSGTTNFQGILKSKNVEIDASNPQPNYVLTYDSSSSSGKIILKESLSEGDGISISGNSISVNSTVIRTTGNQTIDGDLQILGTVTASNFITTSDRRLKTEIKPLENAIDLLSKFTSYEYIKDNQKEAGFIAQEIKEHIPYSVFENNEGYLTMSDRPILAYIHKAILELKNELDIIKSKLN